jgi:uncharacterized protein (TIGR00297 family)
MISILQLVLGFLFAVLISLAARYLRALSISGAVAATILGTIVFGLGGLPWAVVLVAFFTSSSLLSRLFRDKKKSIQEKYAKGSQRDAIQVLANGGIAGVFVLLHVWFPGSLWVWLAFAGSLAAANADTWSTELGVLSPTPPRLITTRKIVDPGTSGGVTWTGTLASLGGGLFIGLLATFFPAVGITESSIFFRLALLGVVGLAGFLGSLVDSLLGATIQAVYYCPSCKKETERHPLHSCGTPTQILRGFGWFNNDWVNALCTFVGAMIALIYALQSEISLFCFANSGKRFIQGHWRLSVKKFCLDRKIVFF